MSGRRAATRPGQGGRDKPPEIGRAIRQGGQPVFRRSAAVGTCRPTKGLSALADRPTKDFSGFGRQTSHEKMLSRNHALEGESPDQPDRAQTLISN
jgi:hypothetical protein